MLGNEDLSSLFASSIAAPAPTADDRAEPEGEEVYNSGELDLRTMADAYFRQQEEAAARRPASDGDPVMLAPAEILIPSAEPKQSSRALPIALIGALALLLIAGTVMATLLVIDRSGDGTAQAEPAVPAVEQVDEVAPPVAPAPLATPDEQEPVEPEPAAEPEPAVEAEPRVAAPEDDEARAERRARREARAAERAEADEDESDDARKEVLAELRASKTAEEAAEPEPEPKPAAKPEAPACDEVACLVNPSDPCCAGAGRSTEPKAEAAADSDLPEKLTSRDVNAGLQKVRGRISTCGTQNGFSGVAKFKLTIAGDGTLTRASVDKGSAAFKSCVTDKLQAARFEKTRDGLTVTYPFVFR